MSAAKRARRVPGALLLLCLGACSEVDPQFEQAWVRAAPDGRALGAAYLQIDNSGPAMVLLRVSSDAHRDASFHETVLANGMSRMRALQSLSLERGEQLRLVPGGVHIMLMGPQRSLQVGDIIQLSFEAKDGRRFSVPARVQREAP